MKKIIVKKSNKAKTKSKALFPKIFNSLRKKADREQYDMFLDLTLQYLKYNRKMNTAKNMFHNVFSKMDKDLDTLIKEYILKVCKNMNKGTKISPRDVKRIIFDHLYYYFSSKRDECIGLKRKYKLNIDRPFPSVASHDIAEKESENPEEILMIDHRRLDDGGPIPETKIIENQNH